MGNCARPSIAPLFLRGVWAAAVIHGAALALDLDLGLAVSRPWLDTVLSKATQRPLSRFAVSGLCGLVHGCYAPETPCGPARSTPSGRSARRLLGSGEWTMTTEYDYEITPALSGLAGAGICVCWRTAKRSVGVFSPCRNTAIFGMKMRSRRYSIASMRTP